MGAKQFYRYSQTALLSTQLLTTVATTNTKLSNFVTRVDNGAVFRNAITFKMNTGTSDTVGASTVRSLYRYLEIIQMNIATKAGGVKAVQLEDYLL